MSHLSEVAMSQYRDDENLKRNHEDFDFHSEVERLDRLIESMEKQVNSVEFKALKESIK